MASKAISIQAISIQAGSIQARSILMVMLALILGAGTALAARETPVPRRLAISPDMVRVAGDGPGQAAPAPQSEADKAWQNLLDEDFEGVFPGDTWTIYSSASVPYWGTWECWSGNTATHSAACAAAGPGAIGCGGLYPAYMSTWMVAGPFDLSDPDITAAELSCVLNLVSETNVDYLLMSVSTDGQNFSGLQYSFLVMGEAIQLDLTAVPNLGSVVGASQVWVGFYFTSDWSLSYGVGAEVDDVLLRVDRPTPQRAAHHHPELARRGRKLACRIPARHHLDRRRCRWRTPTP